MHLIAIRRQIRMVGIFQELVGYYTCVIQRGVLFLPMDARAIKVMVLTVYLEEKSGTHRHTVSTNRGRNR
jgi:hypothetical protein